MFTKYELILSDDDRATLLVALADLRRKKQEVLEADFYPERSYVFARSILDSTERLLHVFEVSGEVVSDVH